MRKNQKKLLIEYMVACNLLYTVSVKKTSNERKLVL